MCKKCTSWIENTLHEKFKKRYPLLAAKFIPQLTIRELRVRLDLGWEEEKIDIEADSVEYHSKPEELAADRARDYRMLAKGWYIIRVHGPDIYKSPDTVADQVFLEIRAYIAGRTMERKFRDDVEVAKDIKKLSKQAKRRVWPDPIEMMLLKPEDR